MRYFVGISCEEYEYYENICFCNNDLFLLGETLKDFSDYSNGKDVFYSEMLYIGHDGNCPEYWYKLLKEIAENMTSSDTLLFYFAGHGTKIGNDAYFILPNTVPGDEATTAISLKQLNEILKRAKGIGFSIIDACQSGADVRNAISLFSLPNDYNWAVLASCSERESSYPDSKKEQGIFTYYVAEEIKNWDKGKEITIEALKIKVSEDMTEWCEINGLEQHPTLNASISGLKSFAVRNNKKSSNEVDVTKVKNIGDDLVNNVIVATNAVVPALWVAEKGIELPKRTDISNILSFNVQLKQKDVAGVYGLYNADQFDYASEIIWERSIIILRERVLTLGTEFVGEMVGIDNMDYIKELPAFEVINVASELGFVNSTGKMRLNQANEIVQHYKNSDIDEEMPQNEADSVVRACIQYILGYDSSSIKIEFGDFRTRLKHQLFEKQQGQLELMDNSPYFYKKTTVRTLLNLLSDSEGAEYETVASNFISIISHIWDSLSSDDRYSVGLTYSKYANAGDEKNIYTFKKALERVHGFDYVPENLRSLSFIQAAKEIKQVHTEFNNFYKEPEAVRNLEKLGHQIPKPALKESISACLFVILGNAYGTSTDGEIMAYKVLDRLDSVAWDYYINQGLIYDDGVLSKISSKDRRTKKWFEVAEHYQLCDISTMNPKLQILLKDTSKKDINNTAASARILNRENMD